MAKKSNDDSTKKATKDDTLHKTKSNGAKSKGGKNASKEKAAAKKPKKVVLDEDGNEHVVRMVPTTLGTHALAQIGVHRRYGDTTGSITRYVRIEADKIAVAALFNKGSRATVQLTDYEQFSATTNTASKRAEHLAIEAAKIDSKQASRSKTTKTSEAAAAPKKKRAAAKKHADEDVIVADGEENEEEEEVAPKKTKKAASAKKQKKPAEDVIVADDNAAEGEEEEEAHENGVAPADDEDDGEDADELVDANSSALLPPAITAE